MGKVYIAGSGPGDPELLTLQVKRVLSTANVVIYDYLANPEHLVWAPEEAEKIAVGKGIRKNSSRQAGINRLMVRKAKEGKQVVRLKGGDPYLFGRGAEEALYLKAHRVSFEVLPGITSANGCAAYAGIPLTHRKTNAHVTFVTGHRATGQKLDSLDWGYLASIRGTLVIYMGFYNLPFISKKLIDNGMPGTTPAACVQWGTLNSQKTVVATLANLAKEVKAQSMRPPSLIIIGDVVRLSGSLNWFARKPLLGKRIIRTRLRNGDSNLWNSLRLMGADILDCPVIGVRPLARKDDKIFFKRLLDAQWIFFLSAYGVDIFMQSLKRDGYSLRDLAHLKVACVGDSTASRVHEHNLWVDYIPKKASAVSMAKGVLALEKSRKLVIACPRTEQSPDELRVLLNKQHIEFLEHPMYESFYNDRMAVDRSQVRSANMAVFTSALSVVYFQRWLKQRKLPGLIKDLDVACIGPATAQALKKMGCKKIIMAKFPRYVSLVEAIRRHYQ